MGRLRHPRGRGVEVEPALLHMQRHVAIHPWGIRVGADPQRPTSRPTPQCRPAEHRRLRQPCQSQRFLPERIDLVVTSRLAREPPGFAAGYELIARLVRRLTTLPFRLTGVSADLARNPDAARSVFVPTAFDNMSPQSPFIRGLLEVPVAPSIKGHSIISVDAKYWTDGRFNSEQGNDGVVAYSSAHIEPVESELVVRSPHSCQGNAHTIEEVRRILRLHVGVEMSTGRGSL